jgi:hypothetical protein
VRSAAALAVADKKEMNRAASAPVSRKLSQESSTDSSAGGAGDGASADTGNRARSGSNATAASVTPEYRAMMENVSTKKDTHKTHQLVSTTIPCSLQEYFGRFLRDSDESDADDASSAYSQSQFTMEAFHTSMSHTELTSSKWCVQQQQTSSSSSSKSKSSSSSKQASGSSYACAPLF